MRTEQEQENALFRAWDAGFMAGQRAVGLGGLDEGYPKNPYEWHEARRRAERRAP